ncbi:MAG TPA: biopolymer transporter ExbD [Rhodocyclaceae bacterium]|nr:biopolymer transporter ExbD [Rhodocyclaceae bacterium]
MAFDFETDEEVMSEINMTPLVDVMLVLLIIFIITVPVINHAVPLKLPQASSAKEEIQPQRIQLAIDGQGRIFWNRETITLETLETRLSASVKQTPPPTLHLSADKATTYEIIAQVMSAASRTGVNNLAFVTSPGKP